MSEVMIPELLSNFKCYYGDDKKLLGTVDVELPKIEAMTETISGSGIAGEVETTIVGHIKAMTSKISFRTITSPNFELMIPEGITLTFRGAIQGTVPGTGKKVQKPLVVVVKGQVKSSELGKMEMAKAMGTSLELALNYLKLSLDGKEELEIDQLNYVYKISGTDYLENIKTAM